MSSSKKPKPQKGGSSSAAEGIHHEEKKHHSKDKKHIDKKSSKEATVSETNSASTAPSPSKIIIADSSTFPEWPGSPRPADEVAPAPTVVAPPKQEPATSADSKPTADDYTFGKTLGKGAFGDVVLATHNLTGKVFAAKKIEKRHLIKSDSAKYALTERKILSNCNHPNIVKLVQSFRSPDKSTLYYIMELAPNGTLQSVLKEFGTLCKEATVFVVAEIVSALQYLHDQQGVIHRDLKPENILLSGSNHVKISDFGTAKELGQDRNARSDSFVGTAEYISPELLSLEERSTSKSADLWALGCILYRMSTGRLPFQGSTDLLTFELIQACKVEWPTNLPDDTKDLIEKLLQKDPTQRLGAKSFEDLKSHPFFKGVEWETLSNSTPPLFRAADYSLTWQESPLQNISVDDAQRRFKGHLSKRERVIHVGRVHKLFNDGTKKRSRIMVLTSDRRVLYFNEKNELKGHLIIPDGKDITIDTVDGGFVLRLLRKSYSFATDDASAGDWRQALSTKIKS